MHPENATKRLNPSRYYKLLVSAETEASMHEYLTTTVYSDCWRENAGILSLYALLYLVGLQLNILI